MRRRGLTLLETTVTMFLVALILGLAAALVDEYSDILRHSSGKERTLGAVQVGLERLRSEAREAFEILEPGVGATSAQLRLRTVDPTRQALRLPLPVPEPAALSWNPHDPAHVVEVRYFTSGQALVRQVAGSDELRVADGVAGFSCRLEAGGSLRLDLSVTEDKRTRSLTTTVYLPMRRPL